MSGLLGLPLSELKIRRSAKWTSYPGDVLPLPVAEMDVRLAAPIARELHRAVDESDTGYAGRIDGLISAFVSFASQRWQWDNTGAAFRTCADVAVGATELLRIVASNGRVVVTPPVYPPFYAWIRAAGAEAVDVPLSRAGGRYRLDIQRIEHAFASGVQAMLLCNPHNPTGGLATRDELVQIADAAAHYGVTVISDEIHAPFATRGQGFHPYLSVSDAAAGNGFALHSASKAWNLAGLKCAIIVASEPSRLPAALPHELPWGVGHFGLRAAEVAYRQGSAWLDQVIDELEVRARHLHDLLLRTLPAIEFQPPDVGFLAWLDARNLRLPQPPAAFFLDSAGVALSDGADFGPGGKGSLRLNFGCSENLLEQAVARMAAAVDHLSPSR